MASKACPVCSTGQMAKLNRIEHEDRSITIYWRCPRCSHVQVTRTPAPLNRNRKPKRGARQ